MKKRKLRKSFFLLILIFILSGGITYHFSVPAEAASVKKQTGFVMKNGNWYFYNKNGKKVTGWYQIPSGGKYYFGKTGAAKAGILTIKGKKYCFNSKGKMLTAWQKVKGKTYFFDQKKGFMYTGWVTTASGNRYYFGKTGAVKAGLLTLEGKTYCFSSKGKMYKNYFYKRDNVTCYFQSNGTMAKGRLKVKGSWYSFNRNTGGMVSNGWYKETDGSYYYAGSDGKLITGFYKPDSYYRYFRKSDGRLLTGWQTIDGYKYYFKKKNGIRYDDIILKSSSGKNYYFDPDGKLAISKWITKNGSRYYASSNGVLATNTWVDNDNYVGEDGALIPNYQNNASFRWPLSSNYSYISSYFGNRNSPGGIGSTNHKGIDIPAPTGTPIYAAASGTIAAMLSPSESGGAGYYIKIDHDGTGLATEYMHQSRFNPALKVGDKVARGDIIGYVGSTGNSTGSHLHFGVRLNGVNQNPLNYVKKP